MKTLIQLTLNVLPKVFASIKISYVKNLILIFTLFIATTSFLRAQDWNCDHVITGEQINVGASCMDIQPGDTVCFQTSVKRMLIIANLHGTPENYIVFKNCNAEGTIQNDESQNGVTIVDSGLYRFAAPVNESVKDHFKRRFMVAVSESIDIAQASSPTQH